MNSRAVFRNFLLTAVVLCQITAVRATTVSKDELKKVEDKVLQQSIEHKKLQAKAIQINLELTSVSNDLKHTAKKIQSIEEKLSQMEKQVAILQKDLDATQAAFNKEDANLIKTLSALQNLALRPTESLLIQPLRPVEIIRSAMILRETVPYLENHADFIRSKLQEISNKKLRIEKQMAEIAKQKTVLQNEHSRMKELVSKKFQLRNSVEIKSEQAKKNIDKLASQAQDLRDLLGKIEKQRLEKEKQEAERRRQEEKRKHEEKQSDGLIKSETKAITNIASGFAGAKGSLPLPARGTIITHYGDQKVAGSFSKGITLATREQAQVVSPFDGAVVFAGPFRGYGKMIIIEHGEGYLSLLAGLETIDVELGQMLLAGEPVGQMPDHGRTELYVEIRKNNQPVNPVAWFKI
ncbi:MAG: peptidoglycan DD-metalloendopeptidase family protein [Alphaproteobacteria bacterium]|nr:peptidoglycan DD-metalloendopeptidase family protein [Alphaproteobacteria bacterium]